MEALIGLVGLIAIYGGDAFLPFTGLLHVIVGVIAWLHVICMGVMLCIILIRGRNGDVESVDLLDWVFHLLPLVFLGFGGHGIQTALLLFMVIVTLLARRAMTR